MNNSEKTFRDKLLDMEKTSANYREKYEKEVLAMVEEKLTGIRKWQIIGCLILSVGFVVLFGTLAVIVPKEFPWWGRLAWAIGALFGLVFAGVYARLLKKGAINLRKDKVDIAWLGWGLVVIIGTIALVFSGKLPDRVVGVHWLVSTLFFLVAAGVLLLRAHIQRSEVNTREKLLEIEYRIAELTEKIEGKLQE
jgi:hypothetical protein